MKDIHLNPKYLTDLTKKWLLPITNNEVISLTLTYKQKMFLNGMWIDLDRYIMEQNLKHFLNLVNSKVFGNGFKRYGKKLKVLTKYEYSINQRHHNHLILEQPNRYDYLTFTKIIINSINKTQWFYNEFDIQKPTSKNRKVGWFNYIIKGTLNHSIDWHNSIL